jgi:predicted dienelactone hydrolase
LILDAADRDGLSLIGILQKFPLQGLRVDLEQTLVIVKELNGLLHDTQNQTRSLQSQAQSYASSNPTIDFSALPDLRRGGPLSFSKRTLTLQDAKRSRQFEADLYLPELSADKVTPPIPVVVISHGLASDRTSFVYLAEHFASHGYAVAVPEHPGSDTQQLMDLLRGWVSEVAEPREFVDRPLDISYLLDALEQLKVRNLRLDLQHVGVIGQSFGGYTALAVAGAPIQAKLLAKACLNLEESWNISLALQCRAQVVIDQDRDFRDPRIAAVIAINPMTSALFSAENFGKVQVPTLIVAGDADTIAPAVREQYPAFAALPPRFRNLMIIGGSTHFSTIEESKLNNSSATQTSLAETDTAVARRYMNAVGLAFMDRYVRQLDERMGYVTQGYVQSIQQGKFSLNWLH